MLFICRWHIALQNREYARPTSFPDYFQNPVFRKEEQASLIESNELSKLSAMPVKPPAVYETSSVYYDPLVRLVLLYFTTNYTNALRVFDPISTDMEYSIPLIRLFLFCDGHIEYHLNKTEVIPSSI